MKFDIQKHLQDHAYFFRQKKILDGKEIHFNFSILDLYFFSQNIPIDTTMKKILEELKKPAQHRVKNGQKTAKNGEKKQKWTTRKIELENDIVVEAIHLEGSQGEYTQPHIHFLLKMNGRYGKNFSLLKLHISEVLKRYNLVANFDEIPEYNPQSIQNLQSATKKFFWSLRKLPKEELKKYILSNENKLRRYLELLQELTKKTHNLDYYFKTMNFLQKRLNSLQIDFIFQSHNIRHTYPLENVLSEEDFKAIQLLKERDFSQKKIKPLLENKIIRDFARYSHTKDLRKCYIISTLKTQTELLPKNLKPNQKFFRNFSKLFLEEMEKKKRKSSLTHEDNQELQIRNAFKRAIEEKKAKNEKELKELLKKEGYEFSWKKRRGKIIGITYKNRYIPIRNIGYQNISELRQKLQENTQKSSKLLPQIAPSISYKPIEEKKRKNAEKSARYRDRLKQKEEERRQKEREERRKKIIEEMQRRRDERLHRIFNENLERIARAIDTNRRNLQEIQRYEFENREIGAEPAENGAKNTFLNSIGVERNFGQNFIEIEKRKRNIEGLRERFRGFSGKLRDIYSKFANTLQRIHENMAQKTGRRVEPKSEPEPKPTQKPPQNRRKMRL